MKEIADIIKAFDEATQQHRQTALVTLVHVDGSSYRRPGARMLVTEDGQLTGAISGGCLEGDALRKALRAIARKKPMLVTYDTNDEDDALLGMELGCNGVIQVLIEPIDTTARDNPVEFLKMMVGKRQRAVLVTLFSLADKKNPQPGTCLLYTDDGFIAGSDTPLRDILIKDSEAALAQQQSSFKNYIFENRQLTAFIEMIQPVVSLVIIGAGNDVFPLVEIATIVGWKTTVIDGRPAYAKADRFSSSCQVLLSKPEDVLNQVTIDEQTVFVLMTHNYNYDIAMLSMLLTKNLLYIGMLGARKKKEQMLAELQEKGLQFTQQQLSVLHSPVGLDIGAETSEEIALSIIAEIKAALSGRQTISLKNNTTVIHDRSAAKIEEVKIFSKQ
jgi:xanthine/CO dehydrogenase XdhC/CoxF family maturation factor